MTQPAPLDIPSVLADIAACAEASISPSELTDRMIKFGTERSGSIVQLRMLILSVCADWIIDEETVTTDREVLDRTAAVELLRAAALIVRSMKVRQGEELSPGRFAIVVYEAAKQIGELPWHDNPPDVADEVAP